MCAEDPTHLSFYITNSNSAIIPGVERAFGRKIHLSILRVPELEVNEMQLI